MSWDHLIGQSSAQEYLRSALRSGRVAHTYLFKGPSGVGKRTAAYLFAQVALCHHPSTPDTPCGQCQSCRWFAGRKGAVIGHPDVIALLKFNTTSGEKLVGDHEMMIGLETVQYVCEQLHRSPMSGRRRVAIIPEAQRMCRGQAESANAFLKTLEEPPEPSLIILTSSQPEGLLETITSRTQAVQFKRLSAEEVRQGIVRVAAGSSPEDMATAALLADGSLGRARELLHGDLRNWRAAVLKELARFGTLSCPAFGIALATLAEAEGKRLFAAEKETKKAEAGDSSENTETEGEESDGQLKTELAWKRYVFRRLLELIEICFRDALVCAATGDPNATLLLQPDQRQLTQSLARNFGEAGCQKALLAIREAWSAVRLYVRHDVVARFLAGKLLEALIAH
ncbi:MAG: DNA polymerase III subunit [Planctomycetota bacterium]